MILTEEELRQAWRNGSGELPEFPAGTRFTPAALDFLSTLGRRPGQTGKQDGRLPGGLAGCPTEGRMPTPVGTGGEQVLQPLPDGKRLVITSCDLDDILAARPATVMVNPGVTLTDAAREILGKAGIRIKSVQAAASNPGAGGLSVDKQELLAAARAGVLKRLGDRADPVLVDAVLQKIVSAL